MIVRWHGASARDRHTGIPPASLGLEREPEVADLAPVKRRNVIADREDDVMRIMSGQAAGDMGQSRPGDHHTPIIHAYGS